MELAQLGRHASAAIVAANLDLLLKSHVVEEVIKVMAKGPHHSRTPPPGSTYAMQKGAGYMGNIKVLAKKELYEITKQDDALSYLSNILGELKEMAVDMGSKIKSNIVTPPNSLQRKTRFGNGNFMA
ncbi:hypothetical protein Tco_0980182 [Tanacetum coccineum]